MEARPKIILSLSPLDKGLEVTSKLFLILGWVLTIFTLLKSPVTVPTHFNASGQPDAYGTKSTLLILPLLATILYFGLTQLSRFPHIFNYMIKITEENAPRQYEIATSIIRFLKSAILIFFFLIILFAYLTTTGITKGLGSWFLPLLYGLLLMPTIVLVSRSFKKNNGSGNG